MLPEGCGSPDGGRARPARSSRCQTPYWRCRCTDFEQEHAVAVITAEQDSMCGTRRRAGSLTLQVSDGAYHAQS